MKILFCKIENFGTLHHQTILFQDGLNFIYGENESGKSTLHAFLRAMLFGIRRKRGKAAQQDEYSRYLPWDGDGRFGGTLEFESGGKRFVLTRDFGKDGAEPELVCATDGERLSVADGDMEFLLEGMDEETFENTVFIRQAETVNGKMLEQILRRGTENPDDDVDYEAGMTRLRSRRLRLRREIRDAEMIRYEARDRLQKQIAAAKADLEILEQELKACGDGPDIREQGGSREGGTEGSREGRKNREVRENRKSGIPVFPAVLLAAAAAGAWFGSGLLRMVCAAAAVLLAVPLAAAVRRPGPERKERDGGKLLPERPEGPQSGTERAVLERKIQDRRERIRILSMQAEADQAADPELQQKRLDLEAAELALRTFSDLAVQEADRGGRRIAGDASAIVSRLTGGRYSSVRLQAGGAAELLDAVRNRYVPAEFVSRGTREQLYFALRAAAGRKAAGEEMPLILDEPFASYDDVRLARMLELLSESGRQVLLFTAQKREAELLRRMGKEAETILL